MQIQAVLTQAHMQIQIVLSPCLMVQFGEREREGTDNRPSHTTGILLGDVPLKWSFKVLASPLCNYLSLPDASE